METISKTIRAQDFLQLKQKDSCTILDVRNPDEFSACHLPGAINLPLDSIEKGLLSIIPRDKTLYLICQSGVRSERARKILEGQGFSNTLCIEGGISECSKVPGAVVKISSRLPLMRQVQIAAGSLVVLGILLSKIVHPAFLFLSLFVGTGLVFAGVSGFCGMAILLEKMPWNRIETD
ncbi:MAG: rhodanese-like domain-containing protein [Deltaproteobacteria bacterium]|nr:rhodanese-like domain-containing protein [Deltaproteobacteria bacterium]